MFNRQNFVACVAEALAKKGYGPKKASKIVDDYTFRAARYEGEGMTPGDAAIRAMTDMYGNIAFEAQAKAAGVRKTLQVIAETQARVNQFPDIGTTILDGKAYNGPGVAIGRALISMIERDPRFKGLNLIDKAHTYFGRYQAVFEGVTDYFSKGAFGRQVGGAHFDNVIEESFRSGSTSDGVAAAIAKVYQKVQKIMINDLRRAGGAMRELHDFVFPQKQNIVKMNRAGVDRWVSDHMDWVDWGRMRFPNGDSILPGDRVRVLTEVFNALSTDGKIKIDPATARGQGASIGNALENHRFLVYKDAASWKAMHGKYGDGTVYDVIEHHMQSMSRKVALVDTFGRNPALGAKTMVAIAEKAAADFKAGPDGKLIKGIRKGKRERNIRALEDLAVVTKRFDMMMKDQLHQTSSDVHNFLPNAVHSTANVLNGALLGSSLFVNASGDITLTMATRMANNIKVHGWIKDYLKIFLVPGQYRQALKVSQRFGMIHDELVGSAYGAERYTGVATMGPRWSKVLGDIAMRMGLLTRHTSAMRMANFFEMMGMLDDHRGIAFDQLDWKPMAERYGITAADWDVVRKQAATTTVKGATFLSPLDILDVKHANAHDIFVKFQSMLHGEVLNMTPDASAEARSYLRMGTTPDTLQGAMVYSASIFKNYPISFFQRISRMGLSPMSAKSKVGYLATVGLGTFILGAAAVQMNEIARGREPMPMDTTAFWIKAMMGSGGLSIWGQYLVQGASDYGNNAAVSMAGPVAGFYLDAIHAALGDGFAWMRALDQGQTFDGKFLQRIGSLTQRYLPGSSVWWARLALEREIWDRFQRWADPHFDRKTRAKVRKQKQLYGNDYFAPPGEPLLR